MKIIIKITLAIVLLLVSLGILGLTGYFYHTDILAKKYSEQGLDVSHHQVRINWKKVDSKKYKYIIMKSTEGKDFLDTDFFYNWTNAQINGFKVGAYHFFTMTSTGRDQANFFMSKVPNVDNSLPPVIDIEVSTKIYKKSDVVRELSDMIQILENHYKKRVLLYVTYNTYNAYIKNEFKENKVWISDRKYYPKLEEDNRWIMWQYSSRGRVEGIESLTDKNVLRKGTIEEFIESSKIN